MVTINMMILPVCRLQIVANFDEKWESGRSTRVSRGTCREVRAWRVSSESRSTLLFFLNSYFSPKWETTCISRNEGNKYSSFQMTVESHHTRVIATLSDWLKKFINQWEAEPMAPCTRDFSRALSKWKVIFRNLIGSFWGCSEWRLLWFSFLRQPFQNRSYNVMSCLMPRTILEVSWNYFFF